MRYENARTKIISFTSGKGGVGKTTLVSNVAYRLASMGKKVLIFDGDLGMANVDIMFGVKSQGHILEVLNGEKSIQDILLDAGRNIQIIPGGSGILEFNNLNAFQRRALLESVEELPNHYDYLLIDTAPGLSENVLYLNSAAQQIGVIINPDPASVADAYALIKILNHKYKENKFHVICNQVKDEVEGLGLFKRFNEVSEKFLSIGLDYWGSIPNDMMLRRSNQLQRLIMKHEPQNPAALSIQKIAAKLTEISPQIETKESLVLFWEQVLGVA